MRGRIKHPIKGQTFRNPQARKARAHYAADLRDLGFTYTAIAEALGLPAHTKERARRIVEYGYRLRVITLQRIAESLIDAGMGFVDDIPTVAEELVEADKQAQCNHAIYDPVVHTYRVCHSRSTPKVETYTRVECSNCGACLELIQHDPEPGRPATDENGHTLRVRPLGEVLSERCDELYESYNTLPDLDTLPVLEAEDIQRIAREPLGTYQPAEEESSSAPKDSGSSYEWTED